MIDLSRYQGIIFDMDGTLVDSMGVHVEAWQVTCREFGYPFDREYHHSLGGVPTAETAVLLNKRYGCEHDPYAVAAFKKKVFDELEDLPALIEDTHIIFQRYIGSKPISVGTGSDRAHATWLLSQHNLLDPLHALATSDDVAKGKPHPDTFLLAAKKMGIAPENCVVFEDTEMGRQAAVNAGMACIMVINGQVQTGL